MSINFDKIPSVIQIPEPQEPLPLRTVAEELFYHQSKITERTTRCKPIKPLYVRPKPKPLKFSYRFYCSCTKYKPRYCCKHAGNIILDRDVLSKEEHICYLAQPRKNHGQKRSAGHCFYKKVVLQNATARLCQLAAPKVRHLEYSFNNYSHVLDKKKVEKLEEQLERKDHIKYVSIAEAIDLVQEEKRLTRINNRLQSKKCRRYKVQIMKRERKQIRHIVCVLFEEMRDFLLNDQFLMDERSPLAAVILEQIRKFTDKEFITTNNLRNYQKIMANNLSIWINKFIANLGIQVETCPKQPHGVVCDDATTFLPLSDYISLSKSAEEVECEPNDDDDFFPTFEAEFEYEDFEHTEPA